MKTYRIPEGRRSAGDEKLLRVSRFVTALILLAVYPFLYVTRLASFDDLTVAEIVELIGATLLVWVLTSFMARRSLRRQLERASESYELALTDDAVTFRRRDKQETKILRGEVTEIEEFESGRVNEGLFIRAGTFRKFIRVPRTLDGYEEVRAALAGWQEIRPGKVKGGFLVATVLFVLLYGGAFVTMMMSHNLALVAFTGSAILLATAWSVVEFPKQSSAFPISRWRLVFVLLAITGLVIGKLYSLLAK